MEEIIYRRATEADVNKINEFYNSVYKTDRDTLKFNWEFNSPPAGSTIYIVAEYKKQIIGTQCAVPYSIVTHDNRVFLSGKSEDTLVSPAHRGKNVFDKMYAILIEECKKEKILFLWGYTYAVKPFLKLGFQIPYRTSMGIMVQNPAKAIKYFASLSTKNKFNDKVKIFALSLFSWFKSKRSLVTSQGRVQIDFTNTNFNSEAFNYLKYSGTFGLNLDEDFINYRITNNPYNNTYKTANYRKNRVLLASVVFNITEQSVGYLIQLYISELVDQNEFKRFMRTVIEKTDLWKCITLRFWGFDHNTQNKEEIKFLEAAGFTFIRRGISFVWLPLSKSLDLKPEHFVLSRMSSQGTD